MKKIGAALFVLFVFLHFGKAQKVLTGNFGHSDDVNTLLFSNDGKYIVSGSDDGLIKIWDIKTGREIKSLVGHKNAVKSIAYSPDNKYIASEGIDSVIIIWNPITGKQEKVLSAYADGIKSISFSPDGKYLASRTKLWETSTWKEIEQHKRAMVGPALFSPDGKYLLCADYVMTGKRVITNIVLSQTVGVSLSDKVCVIEMWDVETGDKVNRFHGRKGNLFLSLALSPDGKYLAGVREDYTVKIWNTQTEDKFRNISCNAQCIAFSPNGEFIVSGNADSTIGWWNVQSGSKVGSIVAHKDTITAIAFNKNGKFIVSASRDKDIKLWDAETKELVKIFRSNKAIVNKLVLSPNNNSLLSCHDDQTIKIWGVAEGKKFDLLRENLGIINDMDISTDGKFLVSAGQSINLWDLENKKIVKQFTGSFYDNSFVAFNNDNKDIVSLSGKVKIWGIESEEVRKKFSPFLFPPNCIATSNDGKYVAAGSDYTKIKIYTSGGGKYKKLGDGTIYTYSLAYSPDDKILVSGQGNGYIKFWNIGTEREIRTINNDEPEIQESNSNIDYKRINCLNFSSDGKFLVSGSSKLKLWDVKTGSEIAEFKGHTSNILTAVFSADGKYIISGSKDGTVKIWETNTKKLLITLVGIANSDDYVVYTPDGWFDGTDRGMELLHYVDGMKIIPLSSYFENFYTPNLLMRVIAGEKIEPPKVRIEDIKLPPIVKIISPTKNGGGNEIISLNANNELESTQNEIQVTVKITDQGGGIDQIKLFHNNKLVTTTLRGFKPIEKEEDVNTKTFAVTLTNGENKIKVTAFSNQRTESIPDEVSVIYNGEKTGSDLYVFVIGVDEYKNSKYNLNYAIADATSFKKILDKKSTDIFINTYITFLKNAEVTADNINNVFTELKSKTKSEDAFIFYYAGHGVMSEEENSKFYIVPHDVTQLYGNNVILKEKAISTDEFENFSTSLKAQKQVFIFDACQSGGLVENMSNRGVAEEKAIAQLARSTGTFWMTATGSEQFASEISTLGHGVFTYAILQGLMGKADGGSLDKKITVLELVAFLNDKVPELSEEHKGSAQYPNIISKGMDFPLLIVK